MASSSRATAGRRGVTRRRPRAPVRRNRRSVALGSRARRRIRTRCFLLPPSANTARRPDRRRRRRLLPPSASAARRPRVCSSNRTAAFGSSRFPAGISRRGRSTSQYYCFFRAEHNTKRYPEECKVWSGCALYSDLCIMDEILCRLAAIIRQCKQDFHTLIICTIDPEGRLRLAGFSYLSDKLYVSSTFIKSCKQYVKPDPSLTLLMYVTNLTLQWF